jgi:adenylate cyclase
VLDYFGQTVNIAARLQAQAGAGDLVVPEDLAEAAAAGGWLVGNCISERYAATLKGVEVPVRVVRVRRPSSDRSESAATG